MPTDPTHKEWQLAKEILVDYMNQSTQDALAAIELRNDLDQAVKDKVLRLILALNKSKTILQNADSGVLFNQIQQLTDLTGRQIESYQLLELIAVGGMSSIYKAQRTDSRVQKPVAIKILSIQSSSTDVVALFNRELKALSKLNHPNIVSFYHGGESDSGHYYLVMEMLDGATTLDQYIEDNKSDTKTIVTLIHLVAQAMVNAHDHLIIHGDLKAENILVDVNQQLKVVDFGIAAFTYQNQKQASPVYTPSIASPEQVMGENITVKSDVYSLGATLLQLISGKIAQPEQSPGEFKHEAVAQHVNQILTDVDMDYELSQIIRKSMHFDPSNRYVTMNAMAVDLDHWLTAKPVSAVQGGYLYHCKKFAVRNKLLSGGLVLLMSLLLIAFLLIQNYAIEAKNEAVKAQTTLDFMTSVLSQADPAHRDQGNTTIREAVKITLEQSNEFLENNPESQIEILTQVAAIYTDLALYIEAANTAEKIHQAYVKTEGELSKNAMYWLYEAAGHYHAAGAFEQCLEVGHAVIETMDREQLNYPSVRLNALNAIIKCHVERFENDQAYDYMKVAQTLMESGLIKDHEALGRTYNSFAVITRRQGAYELSEGYYQKSLFNIEKSLGKDNTAYATITNGMGRMLMLQGKYEAAKPYLIESIELVQAFDSDSHVLARNMSYYAKYLFDTDQQQSALTILDEATVIAKKRNHLFTLMIIQDLRFEYNRAQGSLVTALDASMTRIESALQLFGRDHERVSRYNHEMADLLSAVDQFSLAELFWQNNSNYYWSNPADNQQSMALTQAFLALNAMASGSSDAAAYSRELGSTELQQNLAPHVWWALRQATGSESQGDAAGETCEQMAVSSAEGVLILKQYLATCHGDDQALTLKYQSMLKAIEGFKHGFKEEHATRLRGILSTMELAE